MTDVTGWDERSRSDPVNSAESNNEARVEEQEPHQISNGPRPDLKFWMPKVAREGNEPHIGERFLEGYAPTLAEGVLPPKETAPPVASGPNISVPTNMKTNTVHSTSTRMSPFYLPQQMRDGIKEAVNAAVVDAMKKVQADLNAMMEDLFRKMLERIRERGAEFDQDLDDRFANLRAEIQGDIQSGGFPEDRQDDNVERKGGLPSSAASITSTQRKDKGIFRKKLVSQFRII